MKTTKEATEKRLATMRANLKALEDAADAIIRKGDEMTNADRINLLAFLNVAYHKSGKIEGAASVDGSASCAFCERMRQAAEEQVLIICGACYAFADSWKEAAWRRHKLNARILSAVLFTEDELKTLCLPSIICRINEDGDVNNAIHARNILRLIKAHPDTFFGFGFWYKNSAAMHAAMKEEGYTPENWKTTRPQNVRFVKSSLLIGFPAEPDFFTDIVFTVYPDKATTESAIRSGSWECNGRKCKDCGWNCYNAKKNGETVQHVAEYLRTNATNRAEIMKAYDAKKKEVK